MKPPKPEKPLKLQHGAGFRFTIYISHESPAGRADASQEVMNRALVKAKAIGAAHEAKDMAEFYRLIEAEPLDAATVDILIQLTKLIEHGKHSYMVAQGPRITGNRGGSVSKYPHKTRALELFDEAWPEADSFSKAYAATVDKLRREQFKQIPTYQSMRRWRPDHKK